MLLLNILFSGKVCFGNPLFGYYLHFASWCKRLHYRSHFGIYVGVNLGIFWDTSCYKIWCNTLYDMIYYKPIWYNILYIIWYNIHYAISPYNFTTSYIPKYSKIDPMGYSWFYILGFPFCHPRVSKIEYFLALENHEK